MSAATVKCPTCGRQLQFSSAYPHRPFCSERCKLIDLGAWLSEERSIAGESVPLDPEEDSPSDREAP